MDTSKGSTERINDEGAVEVNVEAVDYRKSAGEAEVAPPHPEKVVVTHIHEDDGGATGVVGGAAAKVAEKLQSAKEAVTSKTKNQ